MATKVLRELLCGMAVLGKTLYILWKARWNWLWTVLKGKVMLFSLLGPQPRVLPRRLKTLQQLRTRLRFPSLPHGSPMCVTARSSRRPLTPWLRHRVRRTGVLKLAASTLYIMRTRIPCSGPLWRLLVLEVVGTRNRPSSVPCPVLFRHSVPTLLGLTRGVLETIVLISLLFSCV